MPDKPSDTHSISKIGKELEQLAQLKKDLPVLQPFLRLAEVDTSRIEAPLRDLAQVRHEFDLLVKTMDRFNELFSRRGWVAYESLNTSVALEAVAIAETGNVDRAEEILEKHYDDKQVAAQLCTLMGLSSFRPRMRLAQLALIDYREGRYHACVPIILALLDGMVNDLGNRGFFNQNVDLTAWDSIAACDSGLTRLKTLLFTPRKRTTEEPIHLPYRNGIHHGMDLSYDSRMVAAKSWAALFAAADWARRIEGGKKAAPAEEPEVTWENIVAVMRQNSDANARIASWKPRQPDSISVLNGGAPHSPEAALIEFLTAWKASNYGAMAKRVHAFPGNRTLNALAGEMSSYYKDIRLDEFTIETVVDTAPAAAEIAATGRGVRDGKTFEGSGRFRLINIDQQQMPVIHGDPAGAWYVMTRDPWL